MNGWITEMASEKDGNNRIRYICVVVRVSTEGEIAEEEEFVESHIAEKVGGGGVEPEVGHRVRHVQVVFPQQLDRRSISRSSFAMLSREQVRGPIQ